MSTQVLRGLLEKTANWDKDERYMATYDLCNELSKDGDLDVEMERQICSAVLKQLDDTSNDVQSIAVKCLGILMKKVQHEQVVEIAEKLCGLILGGRDELRDIYSIGLKTLITDMPRETGRFVAQYLTERLAGGAAQDDNAEVKLVCLDNLADLLRRFGDEASRHHAELVDMTVAQLQSDRQVVRKRATNCMGALAVALDDAKLEHLVSMLLQRIEKTQGEAAAATLVQAIGTVSRTVGYRMARHLDIMIPLFLQTCGDVEDDGEGGEMLNDLRESCFQAFTALLVRCPREIAPHLDAILTASLRFMCYDPNYTYEEDGDVGSDADEEDDEEYDDDDYEGSDDDDSSWKVRRSALKTLESIIGNRPEMLADLYGSCGLVIIRRFKEREEMVRLDVIACYKALVDMTVKVHGARLAQPRDAAAMDIEEDESSATNSALSHLEGQVPALATASFAQLKGKSVKTKSAVAGMLSAVCTCVPGCLTEQVPRLVTVLKEAIDDRKATQVLKLDILTLLREAMGCHPPRAFQAQLDQVVPICARCAQEEWYKVTSEALRLAEVITRAMRPLATSPESDSGLGGSYVLDASHEFADFAKHVPPLHQCVLPRLREHDIDQEIKECAIAAAGAILRHCGNALSTADVAELLGLIMERLRHETGRLSSLRALAGVATSPLSIDLGTVKAEATTELCAFLRQQNRALKQNALQALAALARQNAGAPLDPALHCATLRDLAPLVADGDLRSAQLAIQLATTVLRACPASVETFTSDVLHMVLTLAASPLLQGGALDALLALLRDLVVLKASGAGFKDLVAGLREQAALHNSRQSLLSIAASVAALCEMASPAERQGALQQFLAEVEGDSEQARQLGLLCVGEIGRRIDLSGLPDVHPRILRALESSSEDTRAAAGIALGALSAGNIDYFLPELLRVVTSVDQRYLALTALKEMIVTFARPGRDPAPLLPLVAALMPALLDQCGSADEAVRNIVAECLGALIVLAPGESLPPCEALLARSSGGSAKGEDMGGGGDDDDSEEGPWRTRWTLATGLKSAMGPQTPVQPVRAVMPAYLPLLRDPHLLVRRAALIMLNSGLHHQSGVVKEQMADTVMPALLDALDIFLERVVNLGPFKHKVDDGLPLRKAALSCVYTGLDRLPDRLDLPALMPKLAQSCGDKAEDMCLLAHQVVAKVCGVQPGAVLGNVDTILGPLEAVLNKKPKAADAGHEVERQNELLRSVVRTLLAIRAIDEGHEIRRLKEILEKAAKRDVLAEMINADNAQA